MNDENIKMACGGIIFALMVVMIFYPAGGSFPAGDVGAYTSALGALEGVNIVKLGWTTIFFLPIIAIVGLSWVQQRLAERNRFLGSSKLQGRFGGIFGSQLLFITSLNAYDGNAISIVLSRELSAPLMALGYGLTSIAGAGAWSIAISEIGDRWKSNRRKFVLIAAISTTAFFTAVFVASQLMQGYSFTYLHWFGGSAVFLIGLMIAGLNIPDKIYGIPPPLLVILVGFAFEGVALWL
jgi:hypothetical protein